MNSSAIAMEIVFMSILVTSARWNQISRKPQYTQ